MHVFLGFGFQRSPVQDLWSSSLVRVLEIIPLIGFLEELESISEVALRLVETIFHLLIFSA